jgi:hypothetical protein
MPIIHPNRAYPHISSLRNHWIHAFSGRISLNTNNRENCTKKCYDPDLGGAHPLAHRFTLRERIATAANCEPFEVSVLLLVELLPQLCSNSGLQLERLVQEGRQLGLLRVSPRLVLIVLKAGAFVLPASSA